MRNRLYSFVSSSMLVLLLSANGMALAAAPIDQGNVGHGRPVCPGPANPDSGRCHAWVQPNVGSSPTGLSPATIKSAYNFSTSSTAGAGKTIAIVDAFDDPTAESDLAVFSSQFGLPACTT